LAEHEWYVRDEAELFPFDQETASVRVVANGLKFEMDRTGTRCVHLQARVLPEKQFNRMVEATRNKSSALFTLAATHLDYLLKNFGERGLVVFCDRQGGRAHYGHLLRLMFEDWSLEIVSETDGYSEYLLTRNGHNVRIIFCEKAEAQCMPVALASMLCKYLRETLMHRFNAWWVKRVPGVAPTAGYHPDGIRFLNDVAAYRAAAGIADADLLRCR